MKFFLSMAFQLLDRFLIKCLFETSHQKQLYLNFKKDVLFKSLPISFHVTKPTLQQFFQLLLILGTSREYQL